MRWLRWLMQSEKVEIPHWMIIFFSVWAGSHVLANVIDLVNWILR